MIESLKKWDVEVLIALNGWGDEVWDDFWIWATGTMSWWFLYLALIVFVFYRDRLKGFISLSFIALCVVVTDQTSVQLFKEVFMRLRPCHDPEVKDLIRLVTDGCGGQYGFVSSHATNTFGLATFTAVMWRKRFLPLTVIMFLWALTSSYSRIYLGVHYPLDVICGALLGIVLGFGVGHLRRVTFQWIGRNQPVV